MFRKIDFSSKSHWRARALRVRSGESESCVYKMFSKMGPENVAISTDRRAATGSGAFSPAWKPSHRCLCRYWKNGNAAPVGEEFSEERPLFSLQSKYCARGAAELSVSGCVQDEPFGRLPRHSPESQVSR